MNSNEHDIALWASLIHGDQDAFLSLFRKYYSDLYHYGNRIRQDGPMVEDALQDLFCDIWNNKPAEPQVSVKAYLHAALKYKILKKINHDKKTVLRENDESRSDFEISPENLVIIKEQSQADLHLLHNAINNLTKRQKEILYLKFFRQMSYEEITEVMNINYQVARNLLCQALQALKASMPPLVTLCASLVMI